MHDATGFIDEINVFRFAELWQLKRR